MGYQTQELSHYHANQVTDYRTVRMGHQAQGLLDYWANELTDNENVLSRSVTIGLTNYRTNNNNNNNLICIAPVCAKKTSVALADRTNYCN